MCEFKTVHTRQSGKDIFIELDIIMPYDYTLEEKFELEKDLKKEIMKKFPTSIPILYVVPCKRDCIYQGKRQCPVKIADSKRNKQKNDSSSK